MGRIISVGWNRNQKQTKFLNDKYGNSNFLEKSYTYKILLTGFGLTQNGLNANGTYVYFNFAYPIIYNLAFVNGPAWVSPRVNSSSSGPTDIFYIREFFVDVGLFRWGITEQNQGNGRLNGCTWYTTNIFPYPSPIPNTGWTINTDTGPSTPSTRNALGGTPGQAIGINPKLSILKQNLGGGKLLAPK